MIAAIMCGGKATRMHAGMEKPLLKVGNVAMVERVFSALARSRRFEGIVAAASLSTPKTIKFLKSKRIEVIETAGDGYAQDLSLLLLKLRPQKIIVVPADVPLLDAQAVSGIVDATESKQEPAISIVLEKEFSENLGVKPSVVFGRYCHSGITFFDTARIVDKMVQERFVVMNRKEIALNVNTKDELELAERLLVQRA